MSDEIILNLPNEQASLHFANQLALCLTVPLVLTFSGELGAGKTTLIRAMLRSLGIQSAIKSPTFSLVESYNWQQGDIHHFDLYRIQHEEELDYLGFRDYFSHHSLCCIEWPEHAKKSLSAVDVQFHLSNKGEGRALQIQAITQTGKKVVACLAGKL